MKLLIFISFWSILTSFAFQTPSVAKFYLHVSVSAVSSAKGWIEFALYRNPDTFAKVGTTYRLARTDAQKGMVNYTFKDLEPGKYAVVVYHDVNQNKLCDKNFFGVPTEGYAFSNNVRPNLSVPSFEDCSFKFSQDRTIHIKMVY